MLARCPLYVPSLGIPKSWKRFFWPKDAPRLGYRNVHAVSRELYPSSLEGKVARPFSELPGNWKSNWLNLYLFWKEGGFHNVHNIMIDKFQTFGPIYREKLGNYESVNIIDPEDAAIVFKAEGLYPERFTVPPWTAYRDFRNKPYGVVLKNGEGWRQDRLALNKEALSLNAIDNFVPLLNTVGEDFVKKDFIDPENQRFIDAITLMFHSTSPMLYIPPTFLRWIKSSTWQDHVKAWDIIFAHADKCIQNIYRDLRLNRKNAKEYTGVLSSLLMQDKLAVEDIKASITEIMAGGVDTTSITLQWAMYELARAPALQEQLRSEIFAAKASSQGDILKILKSVPLVRAAVKETLVQVGIYAMGRDPRFFTKPKQFNPERWLNHDSKHFRGLSFGFGPRQCLGRRIAELEMQLFLIHMLENFKIETKRGMEIGTKFDLILIPDKPIYLTLRPLDSHP
ncbi:hypothetical protein JD844_014260 [Phrynosoma platyrhinos]|uniref:Cholesterol side-chain cleavage enzyme, mitochondrial n=1 Tax=Phrynosoma platyrhinos TaxID=52577 RepID=A0ABQ7SRF2_PHRPL|nr:hypothetical protein JD844_014260 [Phrynosoma platyrhinos]